MAGNRRRYAAVSLVAILTLYRIIEFAFSRYYVLAAEDDAVDLRVEQLLVTYNPLQRDGNSSYQDTFNRFYQCAGRPLLPDALSELVDFSVPFSTNLKILLMGDSVSVQFSQALQEMAGANENSRDVVLYSWGEHEGIHLASARGGGLVAGWRLLHFLSRRGENLDLPNSPGGGWRRDHVHQLLNHSYIDAFEGNRTVESFDVVVFRVPIGWMLYKDVSEDALNEATNMAIELFGATTVVWTSMSFDNNVQTRSDLELLARFRSKLAPQ